MITGEKTQPGLVPRALYDIYLNISESNAASEQSPLASFLFKPKTFVEAVMLKPKELEADKKIKSQMLDEVFLLLNFVVIFINYILFLVFPLFKLIVSRLFH